MNSSDRQLLMMAYIRKHSGLYVHKTQLAYSSRNSRRNLQLNPARQMCIGSSRRHDESLTNEVIVRGDHFAGISKKGLGVKY